MWGILLVTLLLTMHCIVLLVKLSNIFMTGGVEYSDFNPKNGNAQSFHFDSFTIKA